MINRSFQVLTGLESEYYCLMKTNIRRPLSGLGHVRYRKWDQCSQPAGQPVQSQLAREQASQYGTCSSQHLEVTTQDHTDYESTIQGAGGRGRSPVDKSLCGPSYNNLLHTSNVRVPLDLDSITRAKALTERWRYFV